MTETWRRPPRCATGVTCQTGPLLKRGWCCLRSVHRDSTRREVAILKSPWIEAGSHRHHPVALRRWYIRHVTGAEQHEGSQKRFIGQDKRTFAPMAVFTAFSATFADSSAPLSRPTAASLSSMAAPLQSVVSSPS